MNNRKRSEQFVGYKGDDEKEDGPGHCYYAFLLPVTVVALELKSEEALLSEETQEKIGELIKRDLQRVGQAEVVGTLVAERLYDQNEVEDDSYWDEETSVWPGYGDEDEVSGDHP